MAFRLAQSAWSNFQIPRASLFSKSASGSAKLFLLLHLPLENSFMAIPPGPYSGSSTLALVARASAFSVGLVYGSLKLKYLQAKAKSHKKAEAKAHH